MVQPSLGLLIFYVYGSLISLEKKYAIGFYLNGYLLQC
ncbi:hypothetical protein VHARVF571_310023 [Vibrio harveyi]|nr:hypothetical protein VCHENC01_1583 [Vibrio harveyi]CAH1532234.1 hypothetical protein VHARVF571_310023 [Vibrio harveyi]